MTIVFAIVLAVVIGIGLLIWWKRRMKQLDRLDSFKGKQALCPAAITPPDDAVPSYICGTNVAEAGVYKRERPLRGGTEFDCAGCGTKSIWDMDRTNPVLLAFDQPREPRRRRRDKR